ncbi:hypothetical protein DSO57_1013499 [Entomophthora muscae]|uniref:Uncharacterized protein n=1 Tax=Entomophthora muscae TaxID=34485 RepID=A0ACC2SUX1_9FUNG|nr:hypothetical protein DSO57_1013499 [Entomophthora muscae]
MVNIIDIKQPGFAELNLKKLILDGISGGSGEKNIPTLVLYDDRGLQLFDQITYLDEYYLTGAEIDILQLQSAQIIENIPDGAAIVELGSGSLRKTKLLLDAINNERKNVSYYALDLMEKELIKSLESLGEYENISTHGFWGTYDDGMDYLKRFPSSTPKVVLWMGSSIGNLNREEAVAFLKKLSSVLNPGDKILVGIDLRNAKEKLAKAYNDSKGVSRDFIINGLRHCNKILDQDVFQLDNFEFLSKVDPQSGHHESLYKVTTSHKSHYVEPTTQATHTFDFQEGEEIHIEFSFKYSLQEIDTLVQKINLVHGNQWLDSNKLYSMNLLVKPSTGTPLPAGTEQSAEVKTGEKIQPTPIETSIAV